MRVIRCSSHNDAEIYHTTEDCPSYPDNVRQVTEEDERRGVRECIDCKNAKIDITL